MNRERKNDLQRAWASGNKGKIKAANLRQYLKRDRGKRAEQAREEKRRLRRQVFDAYGNKCVCCGEQEPEFLTIDHVNGGGLAHRRSCGNSGTSVYRWLRKNGFPKEGFQLLCFNCNRALGAYGYCPHQRRTMEKAEAKQRLLDAIS